MVRKDHKVRVDRQVFRDHKDHKGTLVHKGLQEQVFKVRRDQEDW